MSAPSAVFLTGFMGAGKTSVGRELACQLGWRFVDLDERVVENARRPVAEIFARLGEAEFRRLESQALHQLLWEVSAAPGVVVALGGGTWSQPQNRMRLGEFGAPVVYLAAPVETLRERCSGVSTARPLFADAERFAALHESRRADYEQAGTTVETAGKAIAAIASEIRQNLQLGPCSRREGA